MIAPLCLENHRASFEASLREAPQDEDRQGMPSKKALILRCSTTSSLEGRKDRFAAALPWDDRLSRPIVEVRGIRLLLLVVLGLWTFVASFDVALPTRQPDRQCQTLAWGQGVWGRDCWGGPSPYEPIAE
jgi:hypothetical protein